MRPVTKKSLYLSSLFLILWLGGKLLLPLCFPFFLGGGLAIAAEPMVRFIRRRLRLPRAASCAIGVTMAFCFLVLLIMLLLGLIVRELGVLAGILPNLEDMADMGLETLEARLMQLSSRTPQSIRPTLQTSISSVFSDGSALLGRIGNYAMNLAGTILGRVPDRALSFGTAVISGYMISCKLPKIRRWILRRFPREKLLAIRETGKRIRNTISGWLMAQLKLSAVTFCILFLGFLILGVSYGPVWALAVSLVDAFPVLGTGTILIPWALFCLLQGKGAMAAGILGIYVCVSIIRSVLEPKLLGKHLGLDPLVTLMAMYAGYKLWGIAGMLLAPVLAVTALQILANPGT